MNILKAWLTIAAVAVVTISGQSQNRDRELAAANGVSIDSIYIKALLTQGEAVEQSNPDSALVYYTLALTLSDSAIGKSSRPSHKTRVLFELNAKSNYNVGYIYRIRNRQDQAIGYLTQSLTQYQALAKQFPDEKAYPTALVKSYIQLGTAYYYQSNFSSAVECYQKALEVSVEIDDQENMARCYNNIGVANKEMGNYASAIENYLNALRINESMGNKPLMASNYNNIGTIYNEQNTQGKAIEYFKKALEINQELNSTNGVAMGFNNIGLAYFRLALDKDIKTPTGDSLMSQALNYYVRSVEIWEQTGNKSRLGTGYNNIGLVYSERGNYANAIKYALEAAKIFETIGEKVGIAMTYGNLANYYQQMAIQVEKENPSEAYNHLNHAKTYGKIAFDMAVNTQSVYRQFHVSGILRGVFTRLGEYKEAIKYYDIYIATKDSLTSKEKTTAIAELVTKYETEKKEQEIALQQLTIKKARAQLIVLMLAAGLFALGIVFLGYIVRLKQKTERILAGKNAELQVMNATKDKFFSIISHDLRTPVSGIKNLLTSMQRNIDQYTPEKLSELVGSLNQSAEETSALLNNLLQWAKSQQKKIEVKKFPIRITRLVTKVTDELSTKLEEKQIAVNINIDKDLMANLDENIISTVLRNLLSNAIKFSPSGSAIEVSAAQTENSVRVAVKDNGIGMTPHDAAKLFRIEFDTKSIGNSPEKGSGLGLILCNDLIVLHGGTILVASELGCGSTFTIEIPKT